MEQLINQMVQAAMLAIQQGGLMGYMDVGGRPDPTRNDALDAIWENRRDIKNVYDGMWGAGQYDSRDAVQHWIDTNPEGITDPLQYAMDQGWVEPGVEGTQTPTLAREQFEDQSRYNWSVYEETVANNEKNHLLALGVHEENIRQYDEDRAYSRERDQIIDDQWYADHLLRAGLTQAQIDDTINRFNLDKQKLEWEIMDRDREFARSVGLDEREAEQIAFKNARQVITEDRDWDQWQSEHAWEKERWGEERELKQQSLGLDYLSLLSQLKGPADWVAYSNMQRGAQNTQLPAWANMLAQGMGFDPFQAAGPHGSGNAAMDAMGNMLGKNALAQGGMGGDANLVMFPAQGMGTLGQGSADPLAQIGAEMQGQQPYFQGHQMTPEQWNNMLPSEQQMLQGWVEGIQGDYFDDYLAKMQRAAPTGQGGNISQFGGW